MMENPKQEAPELTDKDMYTLLYLCLAKTGTVAIPQEVFETAPGPEALRIERQWDGTNKVWRFFIFRKRSQRKPRLILPDRRVITN